MFPTFYTYFKPRCVPHYNVQNDGVTSCTVSRSYCTDENSNDVLKMSDKMIQNNYVFIKQKIYKAHDLCIV